MNVVDRVKLGGDIAIRVRDWHLAGLGAVEDEGGRIRGLEGDECTHVAAVDDLKRADRREAEFQLGRAEERAVGVSATS